MKAAYLRVAQLFTGVAIAVLLGIHLVIQHLDNILGVFGVNIANPTSWDSMIARSRQVTWVGIYVALLAAGLFHALYGLRNIILETAPSATAGRTVTWLIIILGIIAFGWGTYVPVALFMR